VSLKRRRRSCLKSHPLTGDERCDYRSTLIRPFKLLRSREMIDARIPARIHTENPVIIRVLRCFRRENSDSTSLSCPLFPPFSLLTLRVLFFSFHFRSIYFCNWRFKKLFIYLRLTRLEFTIIDISIYEFCRNFLWRTLRNNFSDSAKDLFARFSVFRCSRRRYDLFEYQRASSPSHTI